MSGGILQLVAYGAQDLYLTGQPQITFFKTAYRRHTMFSMESIQQTFNGSTVLGGRVTSTISRNGDLLHKLWVTATLTTKKTVIYTQHDNSLVLVQSGSSFVKNVGHGLLKKVELEIGGQVIDRHYSDWLQIWSELTVPESKRKGYNTLVGLTRNQEPVSFDYVILPNDPIITSQDQDIIDGDTESQDILALLATDDARDTVTQVYVPLQFWFCRNVGLALPLIALQYHEVKVNIELATLEDISYTDTVTPLQSMGIGTIQHQVTVIGVGAAPVEVNSANPIATTDPVNTITVNPDGTPINNITLWADYIYLDVDERKRFAQVSHEYLIDQLQFVGSSSILANATRHSSTLSFNHPVKELLWTYKLATLQNKVGLWSNVALTDVALKLNGHDRFASRPGKYFNQVQPFQHHTRCPPVNNGLFVYSFALKPEEHQPSGSCNFSRIDNAQFNFSGTFPAAASVCNIYAINYNVLRVISGMCGIAYSN